ncbi:PP2C family protein-serine/threonine phosphatase [Ruminococcus sp. NK3A76]|uniref:PP2C family protein-serine/threonine phosphatase n=1 Tax=Ruminococcus sp. NK3A76 TaxID=877411 RepID=UPI0006924EEA|nr:PP2C family protein-serine/threonine phosphatase [Ruminococcus sp. NK3A76]
MSAEKRRRRPKLMIRIALILIFVLTFMLTAMMYAIYTSTTDGFLEAKDAHMKAVLDELYENTIYINDEEGILEWYLDMWEKYPEDMLRETTEEEFDRFGTYLGSLDDEDVWSVDSLKKMPEDIQIYSARNQLENIDFSLRFESADNSYERVFFVDVREEHRGNVIAEYSLLEDKQLGDTYDLDPSEHPAIKQMLEENKDTLYFEKMYDFPEKGSYYIAYRPLIADGKAVAAIGVVYNWDEFQQKIMDTLGQAAVICIAGLLLAMLVLFAMIYHSAVLPVKNIQSGVRDYIETKDSEAIIDKMSRIKQRNEFGILSSDISDLARAIDRFNEENIKLTSERERVAAELDMATAIQAEQLPSVFPAFPDRTEFDIYASMTPAKEVGGDFYDFFFVDDDHFAMVMADVSGKGVPAALFMMMSKILINNFTMMGLSPHEVLERTNDTICKNNKNKMFVTVWLGILEISTGKLTAANAGHEYPIIRQPGGEYELFKDKHGFVIGGLKNKKYKEYEFTLQRGGTLFVYTDGVPEATNAAEEMFGTQRLVDTLNEMPDAAPKELLEGVHEKVNLFVGEAPQFDDLTMLGITLL